MRMRALGNLWHRGRMICAGELFDIGDAEAERLAVVGMAEPVRVFAPDVPRADDAAPKQPQTKKKKAKK